MNECVHKLIFVITYVIAVINSGFFTACLLTHEVSKKKKINLDMLSSQNPEST